MIARMDRHLGRSTRETWMTDGPLNALSFARPTRRAGSSGSRPQLNILIDDAFGEKLDRLTASTGISRQELVRSLIDEAVEADTQGRALFTTTTAVSEVGPAIDRRTLPELTQELRSLVTDQKRAHTQIEKRDRLISRMLDVLDDDRTIRRTEFQKAIEARVVELLKSAGGQIGDAATRTEAAASALRLAAINQQIWAEGAVAAVPERIAVALRSDTRLDEMATANKRVATLLEDQAARPITMVCLWNRLFSPLHLAGLCTAFLIVGATAFAILAREFPRSFGTSYVDFVIGHDDRIVRELIDHRGLHVVPVAIDPLAKTPPALPSKTTSRIGVSHTGHAHR
jgi:hypothetical protein